MAACPGSGSGFTYLSKPPRSPPGYVRRAVGKLLAWQRSPFTFLTKIVLTLFRSAKYSRRTVRRPDGPRPGPDGPRVRRGGGRSPAAPRSRSREGPRRGGEILGVV
jgi:hypothetical protein